jgi:hypothetical protein
VTVLEVVACHRPFNALLFEAMSVAAFKKISVKFARPQQR